MSLICLPCWRPVAGPACRRRDAPFPSPRRPATQKHRERAAHSEQALPAQPGQGQEPRAPPSHLLGTVTRFFWDHELLLLLLIWFGGLVYTEAGSCWSSLSWSPGL